MRRTVSLALAAAAFAVMAPVAHAAPPQPICKLYWPNGFPVWFDANGNANVDPSRRPEWVC